MKNLNVKKKMLEYCKLQGIKTSILAEKINVSPSTFAGSNIECGLNSDIVVNFLSSYGDISADWLMRGEGPMLRSDDQHVPIQTVSVGGSISGNSNSPIPSQTDSQALLSAKDEVIASLERTIAAKDDLISALRTNISLLQDH